MASQLATDSGVDNKAVIELDHASKQISKHFQNRLLPYLKYLTDKVANEMTITFEERAEISLLLSNLASQMDLLWKDIRPEFAFQLVVPSNAPPLDAPHPAAVVNRLVSDGERDSRFLSSPGSSSNRLTADESQHVQSLLIQHTKQVQIACEVISMAQNNLGLQMRQRREERLQAISALSNKVGRPSNTSTTTVSSSIRKRKAEGDS